MIQTMEKLKIAYQAIDLLKSIDMPISVEQSNIIAGLEKDYLREEVIPLLEQEMLPLVEKMINNFDLEITFDTENGLDISVMDQPVTQPTLFDDDSPRTRQKRYILKVTFPDGRVSCHRIVWKTMNDVIRYAGPERVQQLGIMVAGLNLVSSELHELERYRLAQKEVAPGLYVYAHSSTNAKYEQILTISRQLDLGLKVEKVSIIGDED